MRVDKKYYASIGQWSNRELAYLLYYTYGPIDMNKDISHQRIRYDENRRVLNDCFIEPNLENIHTSLIERYNELKRFKFDVDIYIDYLRKLDAINELTENIAVDKPYKSGVFMKDNMLNFSFQFSLYGIKSLISALEIFKLNYNLWNRS